VVEFGRSHHDRVNVTRPSVLRATPTLEFRFRTCCNFRFRAFAPYRVTFSRERYESRILNSGSESSPCGDVFLRKTLDIGKRHGRHNLTTYHYRISAGHPRRPTSGVLRKQNFGFRRIAVNPIHKLGFVLFGELSPCEIILVRSSDHLSCGE
jgi:hypothetical protein